MEWIKDFAIQCSNSNTLERPLKIWNMKSQMGSTWIHFLHVSFLQKLQSIEAPSLTSKTSGWLHRSKEALILNLLEPLLPCQWNSKGWKIKLLKIMILWLNQPLSANIIVWKVVDTPRNKSKIFSRLLSNRLCRLATGWTLLMSLEPITWRKWPWEAGPRSTSATLSRVWLSCKPWASTFRWLPLGGLSSSLPVQQEVSLIKQINKNCQRSTRKILRCYTWVEHPRLATLWQPGSKPWKMMLLQPPTSFTRSQISSAQSPASMLRMRRTSSMKGWRNIAKSINVPKALRTNPSHPRQDSSLKHLETLAVLEAATSATVIQSAWFWQKLSSKQVLWSMASDSCSAMESNPDLLTIMEAMEAPDTSGRSLMESMWPKSASDMENISIRLSSIPIGADSHPNLEAMADLQEWSMFPVGIRSLEFLEGQASFWTVWASSSARSSIEPIWSPPQCLICLNIYWYKLR